jgi:cell wall-associated NlpC family hydrolase
MLYRYWLCALLFISCNTEPVPTSTEQIDSLPASSGIVNALPEDTAYQVPTSNHARSDSIVAFAKTLIGTPYKFGCMAPSTGFDCSGFISYVFNHFNIEVPRSSVDFTNKGTPIPLEKARPGDLILFTGTNSKVRLVGHIGIIVSNDAGGIKFIHSSSGKENAVVITPLNERYRERFVKVIRII